MKKLLFLFILPLALLADWCEISGQWINKQPAIFLKLQDGAYIYADSINVSCKETPLTTTVSAEKTDGDELKGVISIDCHLEKTTDSPITIELEYQGCMENECFLPQTVQIVFSKELIFIKTAEKIYYYCRYFSY